jgi:Fic family protein
MWNWQIKDWPSFEWNADIVQGKERDFLEASAVTIGARRHLQPAEREALDIELLSRDALSTSAIEGEILDRDSVQSSLRKQLGLSPAPSFRARPAEAGIAEMMADLYRSPASPLTHDSLFEWHRMVMNGRRDIADIGRYRRHDDAMQIVSGAFGHERVHFEAPPSRQIPDEMEAFLDWFSRTSPAGNTPLPPLTRAAIAHLWFESVHPFEDGNGRIGRAIAEKALAQGTRVPGFTGLSSTLLRHRKAYYAALERNSSSLRIDDWLEWFAGMALEAQSEADRLVRFLIQKAALLHRLDGALNTRQEKALLRMFAEGPEGFKGGLSAQNYATITGAPPATVTRDLADLVAKGALIRSGERKATRYRLAVEAAEESPD